MGIWLFTDPHLLLVHTVILAFGVFRVIYASHSVRMSATNQPTHTFLLEPVDCFQHIRLVTTCQRISFLVLDCIAFKMEFVVRTVPQFHGSTTNDAISWTFYFVAFEELVESNFFDFGDRNIGD